MSWYVYVLLSSTTGSTYVGVSVDVERRLAQHNGERPGGAKRTTAGRPWALAAVHGPFPSRSEAQKLEWRIKQRRGLERLKFYVPSVKC